MPRRLRSPRRCAIARRPGRGIRCPGSPPRRARCRAASRDAGSTGCRLEFTPSNGEELQSEFLLPIADAVAAFDAVRELADRLRPVLQVCEVRTIAGDELWLSPSSGRDSVAFHFTWTADEAGVAEVLPELEAALAPFDARPHWGKVFTPRDPAQLYPRWADFVALQRELDPRGAFVNDYLRALGV